MRAELRMIALPADALVVGLGGNVGGEPAIRERFVRAREALGQLGPVRAAPLYRSAPIAPGALAAQPAFLNTAVRVRLADATPAELIQTLLELERLLGRAREREARWGPRPIDLDVLVWGTRVIRTPELEVPHPRLAGRRFALCPLAALVGEDAAVPGLGAPVGELARRVADQALEQIAERW